MIQTTLATATEHYIALAILIVIAVSFGLFNLIATTILGPRKDGETKKLTYETGMDPIGTARKRFNIRFYVLAMTFLVFDVEIIFLFPWATVFPNLDSTTPEGALLGPQFLLRMLFFIATSVIAYVYAWKKGVFRYD